MPTDAFFVTPLELTALLDSSKGEKELPKQKPQNNPP